MSDLKVVEGGRANGRHGTYLHVKGLHKFLFCRWCGIHVLVGRDGLEPVLVLVDVGDCCAEEVRRAGGACGGVTGGQHTMMAAVTRRSCDTCGPAVCNADVLAIEAVAWSILLNSLLSSDERCFTCRRRSPAIPCSGQSHLACLLVGFESSGADQTVGIRRIARHGAGKTQTPADTPQAARTWHCLAIHEGREGTTPVCDYVESRFIRIHLFPPHRPRNECASSRQRQHRQADQQHQRP